MKIDIRIPTIGQPCLEQSRWLTWLSSRCDPPHDFNIGWLPNVQGPARGRNQLIDEFLDCDADVLWLLDDDVVPPYHFTWLRHAVAEWKTEPARVISGWYHQFSNERGPYPCVYDRQEDGYTHVPVTTARIEAYKSRVLVDAVGAGCLLLTREACESVQPIPFEYGERGMSEDLEFCRGLPCGVILLPKLRCSHFKVVDVSAIDRTVQCRQSRL